MFVQILHKIHVERLKIELYIVKAKLILKVVVMLSNYLFNISSLYSYKYIWVNIAAVHL